MEDPTAMMLVMAIFREKIIAMPDNRAVHLYYNIPGQMQHTHTYKQDTVKRCCLTSHNTFIAMIFTDF